MWLRATLLFSLALRTTSWSFTLSARTAARDHSLQWRRTQFGGRSVRLTSSPTTPPVELSLSQRLVTNSNEYDTSQTTTQPSLTTPEGEKTSPNTTNVSASFVSYSHPSYTTEQVAQLWRDVDALLTIGAKLGARETHAHAVREYLSSGARRCVKVKVATDRLDAHAVAERLLQDEGLAALDVHVVTVRSRGLIVARRSLLSEIDDELAYHERARRFAKERQEKLKNERLTARASGKTKKTRLISRDTEREREKERERVRESGSVKVQKRESTPERPRHRALSSRFGGEREREKTVFPSSRDAVARPRDRPREKQRERERPQERARERPRTGREGSPRGAAPRDEKRIFSPHKPRFAPRAARDFSAPRERERDTGRERTFFSSQKREGGRERMFSPSRGRERERERGRETGGRRDAPPQSRSRAFSPRAATDRRSIGGGERERERERNDRDAHRERPARTRNTGRFAR